ncbi:PREDICTED: probable aspartic protease At2g35615, partial [Nelumbo nucifera]|uniref:Probable aspartic protease At2g35615 n=1 Tax=Nelumbo nucifera TaxID=4432 RepID=A0A1U8BF25_NELNU
PSTISLDSERLFVHFSALRSRRSFKAPIVSSASTGSGQYFGDYPTSEPLPCWNCSKHPSGSAFLARHSITFAPVHCYDSACQLVPHPLKHQPCNHTRLHSTCRYDYSYADGSRTSGLFATETTTLKTSYGGAARLKNLAFGCGSGKLCTMSCIVKELFRTFSYGGCLKLKF